MRIRCGACLNARPVYRHAGGHAYRSIYCGPIGSVITPTLEQQGLGSLPFASPHCGACREVCPVRIDLPKLLLEHRSRSALHRGDGRRRIAVTADAELPSALTLITGPSRTADIELVLTIGVLGPKELHLVLIG